MFNESSHTTPLNGRFTDMTLIGSGGMAQVFQARDLTDGKLVAVKILRPETSTERGRARFEREIRIIRGLVHPNVLPLIDSGVVTDGEFSDSPFFVMPLVRGESLRARLIRERQLSVEEAIRIVRGIASGLAAAHGAGIVHRDVKPENVLLDGERVLVADFGIARLRDHEAGATTSTGSIIGTPAYMSPEQLSADRGLDHRSDIYSLGILFYELLAGNPPFSAALPQAVSARHLVEPPPPLRVVRPDVSPALSAVIVRSLAKVPASRQESCEVFLRELDRALANPSWPRSRSRTKWIAITAGVVLVTSAAALAMYASRPAPDPVRLLVVPVSPFPDSIARPVEERLRDELGRWTGLHVVESMEAGAVTPVASSLTDAAHLARRKGAGLVVTVSMTERTDSFHLSTALVNVMTTPRIVRTGTAKWARGRELGDSSIQQVSKSLLVPPRAGRVATRSYLAAAAFADGLSAVDVWDLRGAEQAFERASRSDQEFERAQLWLALVRTWLERPLPEWSYLRIIARKHSLGELTGSDSAKLAALALQASGDLPGACRTWRRLTVASPTDFASWYGLAYCLHNDAIVERDLRFPGGWRFRGSRREAVEAYRRALELLPASHRSLGSRSFERVRRFMLTAMTSFVSGRSETGDLQFAGLPDLDADTLVLRPIPMKDLQAGRADVMPAKHADAVAKQRLLFDSLATSWATAFPESSDALLARAISLEMLGDERMLSIVQDARMRARTVPEQLSTGLAKVRMLIKRGIASTDALGEGRALADSLVRRFQGNRDADARMVATIAALTGRVALAATELRRETGTTEGGRTVLRTEGDVLLLYAATRFSKDSVAVLSERVDQLIQQQNPDQRDAWRMSYIGRSATLFFPDTMAPQARGLLGRGDYLLDAQLQILAGESVPAARQLIAVVNTRTAPAADVPLDAVCPEAETVSAAGDRDTALRWLRAALNAFPLAPPEVFSDVTAAAVLGPCLRFAAALEDAFGNERQAAQWQRAADILLGSSRAGAPPVVR